MKETVRQVTDSIGRFRWFTRVPVKHVYKPQETKLYEAGRQGRGTHAASRMTSSTAPSPLRVCRSLPPPARGWGDGAPRSRHSQRLSPQSKGPDFGSPPSTVRGALDVRTRGGGYGDAG